MQVSVEVTNTGDVAGEEVVQMYIRDHFASVMRPVKELRGFDKIMLDVGETKTVTFDVNWKTFGFYGQDQTFRAEPGMFSIMIGGSSDNVQSVDFELVD